ncbi:MAG TPA: Wzz/FepE/Etk N-terminal domain-containing protein, partial [Terriglobales bacterium]|nr:Wzz/FepE/Etk N-terminal domain-containing protein [Terriglobales bacterium]
MLGHRKLSPQDYFDILKRRGLLIAGCIIAFIGIGIGVSHIVPPVYESKTLILIEPQKVPENYVRPVVRDDLDARLASEKELILSRSRLEPIITRYNLSANGRSMDDRVDMTRKSITVSQIQSTLSHGGTPGFYVSFDARDAHTAQLVCSEIASLFVNSDLHAQEQSAEGTTDFLAQQLDDAKRTLDEEDAKLAAFQEKYIGRLPDEEGANSNELQALTSQLDATTQSINQMQQNETFVQTMIAQQEKPQGSNAAAAEPDERQLALQKLIEQRRQLEIEYTPDYPDVIAISQKIADLQAEMKHPAAAPKATDPLPQVESPQLRQLRAQLRGVQQSLANAKAEQATLKQRIGEYESRIEQVPAVAAEYKQITRDHDAAVNFYNSLLAKKNESSMATALQLRQGGEQFSVTDPPNLPDQPKFPNRFVFAGGGFMAGLAFGSLLSGFLEYRNTFLRSEADISAFTELPTLAVISHVDGLPKNLKLDSG